jgi:hypothetical protein
MGRQDGPDWTSKDRAIAQAWVLFQDLLCQQCGNPKKVCHDPDLDGELYGEVVHCHLTAAIARAQQREMDRYKGQAGPDVDVEMAGAYVTVKRRPPMGEEPQPGSGPATLGT